MFAARYTFLLIVALSATIGIRCGEVRGETVRIRAAANQSRGRLVPIWRFVGYDEANYTFSDEGKKLLAQIAELRPQPFHIRAHHLLTSGDGSAWLKWSSSNAYREDDRGQPLYDWTIVDRIFDTYHERGLHPYVEIGFMPQALSVHPDNYTPPKVTSGRPKGAVGGGAFYPPRDYTRWEQFIEAWARHCAQRYGQAEAASWYWELWNEPNIAYWKGTAQEYNRLYDHTAAALRRALPDVHVGGPHVTNPGSEGSETFLRQFLDHCLRGENAVTGAKGAPLDFLAFHAKGGTAYVDGHVRMNLGNHLKQIDRGCEIVASYPQFRSKPIVVGESDPDGCAACAARHYPQNDYRNGAQYAAYTAATFLRKQEVAERHGVRLEGALTWAFAFPNQPWFEGFRTLATNGIPKPVFNAFRMFSLLEGQRIAIANSHRRSLDDLITSSVRSEADVDALGTRGENTVAAIVWHYHDDGDDGPNVPVELTLTGLPPGVSACALTHHRIDSAHSNAYTAWQQMGSPQQPTRTQYESLEHASELQLLEPVRTVAVRNATVLLRFSLPRQSVSLIRLSW